MNQNTSNLNIRWFYLLIGVIAMLLMGRRKTMLCGNILFFYKYGIYDLYRYGRIYYAVSFKFYCINFKYFYPQTIKTRGVDKLIFVRQPHFLDSI